MMPDAAFVRAGATVNPRFLDRYLDPSDRLSEILFGLIMVLTFTLTAGVAIHEEPGASREMLYAVIGCNIAWGIIDGVFFVTAALLKRARTAKAVASVQATFDEKTAMAEIAHSVEGTITELATEEERRRLYRAILEVVRRLPPPSVRLRKEDLVGALASFALVVMSTFPAVLPFLFIDEPRTALRASNALLLIMLFGVGYQWGAHAFMNRWLVGFVALLAGLALVALAIALGG